MPPGGHSPPMAGGAPLTDIETWVFDLDNTLYPVTERLLAMIDRHMSEFVARFLNVGLVEARNIQKTYFRKYGLTLRGLMIHHGLDPVRYYDEMTPMDLNEVDPNPALADAIRKLAGRKLIYTNASSHHAEMVLDRLGMAGLFEGIFDIGAAEYLPKPAIESYRVLCDRFAVDPARAAMIDDIARNLEPAWRLGMTTVWMKTNAEWSRGDAPAEHIHHITEDLLGWIGEVG
jgi:putative hydrolase of the HAD superfamily